LARIGSGSLIVPPSRLPSVYQLWTMGPVLDSGRPLCCASLPIPSGVPNWALRDTLTGNYAEGMKVCQRASCTRKSRQEQTGKWEREGAFRASLVVKRGVIYCLLRTSALVSISAAALISHSGAKWQLGTWVPYYAR
jgi:hypothetical protein